MHGPSFFSFHFLSFSISLPKLTIFTILTSLHGLQDVENHCAHLRDNGFLVSKEIGNASVGEMKTKTWFYEGLTLETSAF